MTQGHTSAARVGARSRVGAGSRVGGLRIAVVLLVALALASGASSATAAPDANTAPEARAARLPDSSWLETPDGLHWRVVGGSVLPVSNMTLLGFPPGGGPIWIPVADLSEYAAHPVDGTVIASYGPQLGLPPAITRFAGGAMFPIPDGSSALAPIAVDSPTTPEASARWAERVLSHPQDGTFLTGIPSGRVVRIVGAAPLRIDDWAAIGGPRPTVEVPDLRLNAGLGFPISGTTVTGRPSGRVWRFVGGTPLRIDDWASIGGPVPTIEIPDTALTAATAFSDGHVSPFAVGGFAVAMPSGREIQFLAGAPLTVSDWSAFAMYGVTSRPADLPRIPDSALDERTARSDGRVLPYPESGWPVAVVAPDGSYAVGTTVGGTVVRGAQCPTAPSTLCCPSQIPFSSCYVQPVGSGSLDASTGFSAGFVRPCPVDETLIEGTPSGDRWVVRGCEPVASTNSAATWRVPDAVIAAMVPPADPPVEPPLPPITPVTPLRAGYWMVDASGEVYRFGDAADHGDDVTALVGTGAQAVDLEPTPSGNGYWILDSRGRVTPHGDATDLGGIFLGTLAAGERATSLSATPTGAGYWIFTDRGRVLARGDAVHRGGVADLTLNGPVLDSIATPTGDGYYMVASDGGVFAFGDATFLGSMGATRLNAQVQSLVPDPDGTGYWLVASDGGIFAFSADFHGSMGATPLNRPITGMIAAGTGYLMVGEDGGIFAFGGAPFFGSLGDHPPATPVTSVATL
jgi:hypothetical protein